MNDNTAYKVYNQDDMLVAWAARLETLKEGDLIARAGSAAFTVGDDWTYEPLETGDIVPAFAIGKVTVKKINRVTVKVVDENGIEHTVRR